MNKILSVSIAAYNVSSTLDECLAPFIKCSQLDKLDIIIVNDGSTDTTKDIAAKYQEKYPESIRLIDKANGGWGSTINTGIEYATGKYFKQLDGDDHYDGKSLSDYIEYLETTDTDMVCSAYIEYNGETGEIISRQDCNPGCEYKKEYKLSEIASFKPFMHSITMKTSVIHGKLRVTEKCFYTDTEYVLRSCNLTNTVSFYKNVIYCYQRATVGQSMSLSGIEKHYNDQTIVIATMLEYLRDEVKRPEVVKIYDSLLWGTCAWQYLVFLYISPTRKHKRDFIEYDQMLKRLKPEYYDRIEQKAVLILRKMRFMGYSIIATIKKRGDKRFTKDGRMLY